MKFSSFASAAIFLLPACISAQLFGSVGPVTTREVKRAKKILMFSSRFVIVLDYGAVASKTSDVGPAIQSAFADCRTNGTVYIPPGDFGMSTWVTLSGGHQFAIQLDGIICRVGTDGGNMIFVKHAYDFEMYSSTSQGAIQGYGYEFHKDGTYGPRLLRTWDVDRWSVHDIALVDSPAFHFSIDTCANGEVYNMAIWGGYQGGLDGIDVWGDNIWIHDVTVSNKDECVTVKSPAHNMLIEDIYCNASGGCAMGSLGTGTNISSIHYKNIYTWQSNQMYMIKSNGGSGSVSNCTFENFIGHSNAYSLNINAYWTQLALQSGDGVLYQDLSFINWSGTSSNGVSRAPVNVICPDDMPCEGLGIDEFEVWTETGDTVLHKCANAFGSGACLKAGTVSRYDTVTSTIAIAPAYTPATMDDDLPSGWPITASIPIPTIPVSFFPGATPASKLLGAPGSLSSLTASAIVLSAASSASIIKSSSRVILSSSPSATVSPSSSSSSTLLETSSSTSFSIASALSASSSAAVPPSSSSSSALLESSSSPSSFTTSALIATSTALGAVNDSSPSPTTLEPSSSSSPILIPATIILGSSAFPQATPEPEDDFEDACEL